MNINDFSGGYLRTRLKIVRYEDGPVMERGSYSYIERQVYGGARSEPMFRFGLDGNPYFTVGTEFSIPKDVIGVPESWFGDNMNISDGVYASVFIVKPGHADVLMDARRLSERFSDVEEGYVP
jgi:hypothetical protein